MSPSSQFMTLWHWHNCLLLQIVNKHQQKTIEETQPVLLGLQGCSWRQSTMKLIYVSAHLLSIHLSSSYLLINYNH